MRLIEWALIQCNECPHKKGEICAQHCLEILSLLLCGDFSQSYFYGEKLDGRNWGDASTSQGVPRMAKNHQRPGERHRTDSPPTPGKIQLC